MRATLLRVQATHPALNVVYGVWNEPDIETFWTDTWLMYELMFYTASLARDSVSPSIRLAGPDTTHGGLELVDSIVQFMHASDIVTVHWYAGGPDLRPYMESAAQRAQGREVWLTETGMNTPSEPEQSSFIQFVINTFEFSGIPAWTKTFIYHLWAHESFGITSPETGSPRWSYRWYLRPAPKRLSH